MAELNPLYQSKITCPVCEKEIEVTKVRSKFIRLVNRMKILPHYETWNPVLYRHGFADHCGYAAIAAYSGG